MAKYSIEDTTLTGMSDAVRGLNGDTAKRTPSQMMTAIAEASGEVATQTDLLGQISAALEGKGSASLPQLTNPAGAAQILKDYEAIDEAGTKMTGTIPSQAAQTITPGTADKTIAAGRYLTGVQTIKGDANLVAENIKSGVSIFGVSGSLKSVDLSEGIKKIILAGESKALDSTVTGIPLNAICWVNCTSTGCYGLLDANETGTFLGKGNTRTQISDRTEGSMSFTSYKSGSWESTKGTIWWYVP